MTLRRESAAAPDGPDASRGSLLLGQFECESPMRFEPSLTRAILRRRFKRFLAEVEMPDGERRIVHCPNTGAMTGCGEPGSIAWISTSTEPRRKYRHTLEIVELPDGARVGINSARANRLVEEALEQGGIPELPAVRWRREPRVEGATRFDFALELGAGACYLEIKSVSWRIADGRGAFPDARSERATRQLRALIAARAAGARAVLFYCVQHDRIERVLPAHAIDPHYCAALREAVAAGVELLAYRCALDANEIRIVERVAVEI
jgi:sugar fermentation stimulation protein A